MDKRNISVPRVASTTTSATMKGTKNVTTAKISATPPRPPKQAS
jgi:hypothetical protein